MATCYWNDGGGDRFWTEMDGESTYYLNWFTTPARDVHMTSLPVAGDNLDFSDTLPASWPDPTTFGNVVIAGVSNSKSLDASIIVGGNLSYTQAGDPGTLTLNSNVAGTITTVNAGLTTVGALTLGGAITAAGDVAIAANTAFSGAMSITAAVITIGAGWRVNGGRASGTILLVGSNITVGAPGSQTLTFGGVTFTGTEAVDVSAIGTSIVNAAWTATTGFTTYSGPRVNLGTPSASFVLAGQVVGAAYSPAQPWGMGT